MGIMLTKQLQIAERSKRYAKEGLTNLHHYIDELWLYESFRSLRKQSSPGIDEEDYESYRDRLVRRMPELMKSFKTGSYQAPAVKRVYIPKGNGEKRPIGIPTMEDKLLQNAVRNVLAPVYEGQFYEHSYGFRKGRSAHEAIEQLWQSCMETKVCYVLDADIQDYFGSIDHSKLRSVLDQRVKDGVIRRQIDKWLKAGVMEDGELHRSSKGAPQGGVISPLLSNIYLDEVLDQWYLSIKPLLKGRNFMIRYADDFVMGFEFKSDADRVMQVIFQRFAKYNLTLHPEKTKLTEFNRRDGGSFDFLGFTHYWGKSRKGNKVVKRKTSSKRFSRSMKMMNEWIKRHRHIKVEVAVAALNVKLQGHYNYFGITGNMRQLNSYHYGVKRLYHKWLNRRGGKWMSWGFYLRILKTYPLKPPRVVHSYV